MVFGDLHYIDILVFAAIAGFLIYRLKNVLVKDKVLMVQPHKKKKKRKIKAI